MRLTTRSHGYLDFLLAAVLLPLPWVAGLGGSAAGVTALIAGASILVVTLATNFEMGLVTWLEIPLHLWIDGVLGLLLALSPWLFGFDRTTWIPHVGVGMLIILSALITDTVPRRDRRATGARV